MFRDLVQVIVLVMDKKSTSDPEAIKNQAKYIDESGILVIPVALGREADLAELLITTPNKDNLVTPDENDKPEDILAEIMKKIADREYWA